MCTKDPYEAKYQFLINKYKSVGLKHYSGCKAFIEFSNDMDDTYESIEQYIPNKEHKMLILFGDTITDMPSNKNFSQLLHNYLLVVEN